LARKIPKIVKDIQNFPTEKIDYSYQKNISFSQLSMYTNCPKQWSLQYKEGRKIYNPSIHTVFGTSLHEALQHYLTVMYEESGVAADKEDIIGLFEEKFREEYKNQYKKNNSSHFSSPEEMREFYEDGIKILNHISKKRNLYFSKKGWYLVGCEIPIVMPPNKHYNNVVYQGYLDVVLYHEPTNKFYIIDIKTSTKGWNAKAKKDEIKQFQLILYKKYFSEQFGVPLEDIDIEFFIVKRKLYENLDFPQKRVQLFKPPSGKVKLNRATKAINDFINESFTKSGYKEREFQQNPSKWNCRFCPFSDNPELCDKS